MNPGQALQAKWIWTGEGLPIQDGIIRIVSGRILSVETSGNQKEKPEEIVDLGESCLLPGFINSHTHLEFSDLSAPIPAGKNFAEWILRVVQHRMLGSVCSDIPPEIAAAYRHRQGVQEAIELGTALVLNVVHGLSPTSNAADGLSEIPFSELMATTELRRQQTWRSARTMLRSCLQREEGPQKNRSARMPTGLSPHAPYTTTATLVRQTVDRCRRFKIPLMMHLAETREELEWIASGTGPMEELLEMMVGPLGLPTFDRLPLIGYVKEILRAPKTLLIHGNYLNQECMNALAAHRTSAAVVYCPRTHQHFGHDRYPLEQLLKKGVRVLLGTDSRASNPDLSILEEARAVSRKFPSIEPMQVFEMITSDAAEFLGLERVFGSLRPNAIAKVVSIPCSSKNPESVLEEILASNSKPSNDLSGGPYKT